MSRKGEIKGNNVQVSFPNGKSRVYPISDFIVVGNEMEHIVENIILNMDDSSCSFVYVMDWRGEILFKEPISFSIC